LLQGKASRKALVPAGASGSKLSSASALTKAASRSRSDDEEHLSLMSSRRMPRLCDHRHADPQPSNATIAIPTGLSIFRVLGIGDKASAADMRQASYSHRGGFGAWSRRPNHHATVFFGGARRCRDGRRRRSDRRRGPCRTRCLPAIMLAPGYRFELLLTPTAVRRKVLVHAGLNLMGYVRYACGHRQAAGSVAAERRTR